MLAEPDRALRQLMQGALVNAGYEVYETAKVAQVELTLRLRSVYSASHLLYVLAEQLATACEHAISAAALERARRGLPDAQVILVREFGALSTSALSERSVRRVLEKPFDLSELGEAAFECRGCFADRGPAAR